jgi:predicted O-methyltransferase YrrM
MNAGLSGKVEIITGKAIDSLVAMFPDTPFDLIFIDADKPSNIHYFAEAKRLVRKGGVIVRDRRYYVLIIAQCDITDCGQRSALRTGRRPIAFG